MHILFLIISHTFSLTFSVIGTLSHNFTNCSISFQIALLRIFWSHKCVRPYYRICCFLALVKFTKNSKRIFVFAPSLIEEVWWVSILSPRLNDSPASRSAPEFHFSFIDVCPIITVIINGWTVSWNQKLLNQNLSTKMCIQYRVCVEIIFSITWIISKK